MSEQEESESLEQEQTQEEEPKSTEQKPERPPQIVEIKTPLDKPEFDFFLDSFMKKTGIPDKKQAAIMLTNMFYDMGLNPNDDLKELQDAMAQMNIIFKNLPNTPSALQVKDTMGAMYAAKTGRLMLDKMPKMGQVRSESDDRMERIMDKYMPMILAMKTMGQMMMDPGTQQPQQQQKAQAEVPEAIKKELDTLKSGFSEIKQLLITQTEERKQKEFASGLIATVNSQINPQIDAIRNQVESIANSVNALAATQSAAPQTAPPSALAEEITKIKNDLKDAVDKIGEKAGAKSLTLDDINPVLDALEKMDKRFGKKEPEGEFNWKAATVSTIGEIGKEAISVGKDILASRQPAQTFTGQQGQAPAAPNEMQAIIKRQIQNYILQRLQKGATQMNIEEAAKELGLSIQQVNWAYNILVNEGWITTRPAGGSAAAPAAVPTQGIPPNPPATPAPQVNPQGGNQDIPNRRPENQPFIET